MIDQRIEELAALHVLGALSEAESLEFQAAMKAEPELREFVARLSATTVALAGAVPPVEPPPQLRAKILAQVAPQQKMVSLPERKFGPLAWFATCLAAFCLLLLVHEMGLRAKVADQAAEIAKLIQEAQSLQETNRVANLRIAMLNSLATNAPKTLAVTLWDGERQNGVFVAENLKTLPSDMDYELWVIDENQTPVAAGVFHVEQDGKVRMEFKPSRLIKTAGVFAVTEEAKGGVSSPTLKNMVLAGK